MEYFEIPPCPRLRPYVRCFWVARSPGAGPATPRGRVLPDGCMDIILAVEAHGSGGPEACALTSVGAMTRFIEAEPMDLRIGVRFEPGMATPFLPGPAGELTDAEVPLTDVIGRAERQLFEAVLRSDDLRARLAGLEQWLLDRLETCAEIDRSVALVVQRILRSQGRIRVPTAMAGAGLSARQLRRRFEAAVGLSPKRFIRIVRLQEVLRLARNQASPGWAALAVHAGYYDQAHLIADFRELAGQTPTELLSG